MAAVARRAGRGIVVGYLIAAYLVVIGTLAVYGVSVQVQRRALIRDEETRLQSPRAPGDPGGSGR